MGATASRARPYWIPRDLSSASISAISSSIGGAGCLPAPLRLVAVVAGSDPAEGDAGADVDFLPAIRRARRPPTIHSTRQRPSSARPNQTAGEKMTSDAQLPTATMPFQSKLSRPL